MINDKNVDWMNKPIIMYGIGCIGKGLLPRFRYLGLDILGIAVSDISENDSLYNTDGLLIKNIEQWIDMKDAIILVATSSKYHEEITNKCHDFGFENIIPMTSEIMQKISDICYRRWFDKHNIDISGDYLVIGNGRYINPFTQDIPNKHGFLGQLGDYVIPMIYNDYSFVNEGTYEYEKVVLKKDDVVFDLGANVGSFSVYAASKGCIPYAFEPTPCFNEIVGRHSSANGNIIRNINYAISNYCGDLPLYVDSLLGGGNTILDDRINNAEKYIVSAISIDEFVKINNIHKIDFIKADIEGAERLMLLGATQVLKEFAPKLSLCTYHLYDDKEVLTDLILKANPNYNIVYNWEKLYAWVEK